MCNTHTHTQTRARAHEDHPDVQLFSFRKRLHRVDVLTTRSSPPSRVILQSSVADGRFDYLFILFCFVFFSFLFFSRLLFFSTFFFFIQAPSASYTYTVLIWTIVFQCRPQTTWPRLVVSLSARARWPLLSSLIKPTLAHHSSTVVRTILRIAIYTTLYTHDRNRGSGLLTLKILEISA